jgi:hypothetical protein
MTRKSVFIVAVVVATTAAYLFGAMARSVEAIPLPQSRCAFNSISTSSNNPPQAIPGSSVTVNNGSVGRRALVQFSADTGVETGAEVRISYSIDGGPPREDTFGPANLANHQEFFEARAVIAVISLGPGTHTIRPFWRVSGVAGKNAFMDSRCTTLEARTS